MCTASSFRGCRTPSGPRLDAKSDNALIVEARVGVRREQARLMRPRCRPSRMLRACATAFAAATITVSQRHALERILRGFVSSPTLSDFRAHGADAAGGLPQGRPLHECRYGLSTFTT